MKDESDLWAEALLALLLEKGALVLAKPGAHAHLEGRIAAYFGRTTKPSASALATVLVDHPAVEDLLADDDALQAAIVAAKPKHVAEEAPASEPPASGARNVFPFDNYAPDARQAVEKAIALAETLHHVEVTPWHLLSVILETSEAIAKRRGGDPDKARATCRAQLVPGKATATAIGFLLRSLLAKATDLAPTQVRATDLILAGLEIEHTGFLEAFRPKPPPAPVVEDSDSYDEDEDDEEPAKRAPGMLVVGPSFERAYRLAAAVGRSEGDAWARSSAIHGKVPANLIADAERELGTTLPDEFLAAASAAIAPFAMVGVTSGEPHGEPARGFDVAERILEVASSADAEVPEDFVAIMALTDPNETTYVCIRKGVTWADRNTQPVFTFAIGDDEPEEKKSFGELLFALLRDLYADVTDDKKAAPEFSPRLI